MTTMSHIEIARQLVSWEVFFIEEAGDVPSLCLSLADPRGRDDFNQADVDSSIYNARASGNAELMAMADRCEGLADMWMEREDVKEGLDVEGDVFH